MVSTEPQMDRPEEIGSLEAGVGEGATRVIGGETVFEGGDGLPVHRAYVQLRRVRAAVWGSTSSFVCGGAIVHAWRRAEGRLAGFWVATASHCLDTSAEYQVALWTGEGAAAGQPVALAPSTSTAAIVGPWRLCGPQGILVFKHPLYDDAEDEHDYDIALLRVVLPPGVDLPATLLEEGAQEGGVAAEAEAQPEPKAAGEGPGIAWGLLPEMARGKPVRNTEATVLGFGLTEAPTSKGLPADVSATLQRLRVAVEPTSFRWSMTAEQAGMFTWVVGVPTLLGQKISTVCNGDSGGPLLVEPLGADGGSGGAPTLAGVLCCAFCKVVGRREDLARYPAFYTRVDAFMGPARGAAADLLLPDSAWRHGLDGIIARHSPTLYRTDAPSSLAPASVASPEQAWADGGMAWAEGPGRRDMSSTYWMGAARLAVVAVLAVAAAALTVLPLQALARAIRKRGGGARRSRSSGSARSR
jgi:hypothetical protein